MSGRAGTNGRAVADVGGGLDGPPPTNLPRQYALLLTAAVNPNGMRNSEHGPKEREGQYLAALRRHLADNPAITRVVFAESSGWDLRPFERLADDANPHGKSLECLQLDCNDYPKHLGKSYGELKIMQLALERSPTLAGADYVAKITGRLCLGNASAILRARCRPYALLCDVRDHVLWRLVGKGHYSATYCDTRFLAYTPAFFHAALDGLYERLDDSAHRSIEALMYEVATRPPAGATVVPRFAHEPRYEGVAGHFGGKRYGGGADGAKRAARALSRRVAPWLWI